LRVGDVSRIPAPRATKLR